MRAGANGSLPVVVTRCESLVPDLESRQRWIGGLELTGVVSDEPEHPMAQVAEVAVDLFRIALDADLDSTIRSVSHPSPNSVVAGETLTRRAKPDSLDGAGKVAVILLHVQRSS
jgi:hypothetical protein